MIAQNTIRRATEMDLGAIKKLRHAFFDSQMNVGLLDVPINLGVFIDTGTANLIAGRRNDVFVSQTDKMNGYLYATTRIVPGYSMAAVAVIEEFFVKPELRGTGASDALLEAAIDALNARGVDRIQLRVLANNVTGRSFWNRTGFVENVHILELDRVKGQ
jgi:ribosomal protein S18 acetylase RimI-like enzyme